MYSILRTGVWTVHGGFAERERQWISDRIRIADRGYTTPCWVWPGWLTPKGYAKVTIPLLGERRVHRAAYIAWVGPIPDGLTIDHLCRVKNCCNPAHLEPVTAIENARRGVLQKKARAELSGGREEVGARASALVHSGTHHQRPHLRLL